MTARRTDKRGPDRKLGDGSSHVGALPRQACNQDFRRLADGTPDPRSVSNIKLALDRLGVKRGDRVNTGNLFARMERAFGLKPTPDIRLQTARWLADKVVVQTGMRPATRDASGESLVEKNQPKVQGNAVVEITLKEIAANQGIHYVYAHRLSREKGFPNPVRVIGRNLMFDAEAVSRYFAKRKRRAPRRQFSS